MTRTELRAWLKRRNLSQRAFARLIDVHYTTVARWLSDAKNRRRLPRWLPIVLAHVDGKLKG